MQILHVVIKLVVIAKESAQSRRSQEIFIRFRALVEQRNYFIGAVIYRQKRIIYRVSQLTIKRRIICVLQTQSFDISRCAVKFFGAKHFMKDLNFTCGRLFKRRFFDRN